MRVFVTGGTGYIGGHIVRELLAHGHEITVLRRPALGQTNRNAVPPGLRVVRGDLELGWDPGALRRHDAVIHAGLVWDEVRPDPELKEVEASRAVFEAAARAGNPHLVFLSSAAVHRPFSPHMSERDSVQPVEPYACAKAASEAWLMAHRRTTGSRVTILRAGPTVGPAVEARRLRTDSRILTMWARAWAKLPLRVMAGDGRQLTPIDGLASLVARVVESRDAPELMVAVARELTTWEEVARSIVRRVRPRGDGVVEVEPRPGVVPRFETDRVDTFAGAPLDASPALEAHLDALLADHRPGPREAG